MEKIVEGTAHSETGIGGAGTGNPGGAGRGVLGLNNQQSSINIMVNIMIKSWSI